MSKAARTSRRRNVAARKAATAAPATKAAGSLTNSPTSWWQIYEAADRRDFRGWFYFPNLSPADQLESLSRRAIRERCDWLYVNVGAWRMVIDGLAQDEVGSGLWPKWETLNPKFNRLVTDAFHFTNHDPRVFSANGQDDYYSAQFNIRRMIRRTGDCFGQLLAPAEGGQMPQHHLIPGYLVDNIGTEQPAENWVEGVQVNSLGRALKYRVLNREHPTGSNDFHDVDAADLLHYHEPFFAGQVRGVPTGASVVKKMFRREDVARAIANGTLARERLGFAIEYIDDRTGGPTLIPGATDVAEEETTRTKPDGTSGGKGRLVVQKFYGDQTRDDVLVPEVPNGGKIKMLESNRPGTAVMELQDSILRELAWDSTYPPEYVFDVAGMSQGTLVRLVVEKVRLVINSKREFQLKPQFCNRWNVFWAWQRIKRGAFDKVEGGVPLDWWRHKHIPPRDVTVDIGREAKVYDERADTFKMPLSEYFGLAGNDPEDVDTENYGHVRRRCGQINELNDTDEVKKMGIRFTYFDLHPKPRGAVAIQPPGDTETSGNNNTQGGADNGQGDQNQQNGNGNGSNNHGGRRRGGRGRRNAAVR